jgi:hypothetical protein
MKGPHLLDDTLADALLGCFESGTMYTLISFCPYHFVNVNKEGRKLDRTISCLLDAGVLWKGRSTTGLPIY